MANMLLEAKLAACVNIIPECASLYRWKGKIETGKEFPVIIKTRTDLYQQVENAIKQVHPYELPEIIAVPIIKGLSEYIVWILEQTKE